MQAALAPRGDSRTFLTHFVGSGLDDDRYVVERYRSQADGQIVPVDATAVGQRDGTNRVLSLFR